MTQTSSLVTVFGGSGFVGRHVVRALARAGWRIRVAVRHPGGAFYLPPMGQVGQIQIVKCDVTDAASVTEALAGANAAVNLTGILYQRGHQTFDGVHAEGAANIAAACNLAGVTSLVHVSAIGADAKSDSRYARSKAEGEARVRASFPGATLLRPSIVFGPEDDFFNRFASLARLSPVLPLIGGGLTRFQPVFVGDVARAVTAALSNESARGQTYELGGPAVYTFRELLEEMLRQTGRKRLLASLPFGLARFKALFLQLLPKPLLTPDQVTLLRHDNVVDGSARTLADLGIAPIGLAAELPSYLWRFRPKGQFQAVPAKVDAGFPSGTAL